VSLLKYEEQGKPTYEQIHRATITLLGMLGMHYPVKARLPIFYLVTKLDREYGGKPEAFEARKLLARLVLLRQKGLEPKHSNGQYV